LSRGEERGRREEASKKRMEEISVSLRAANPFLHLLHAPVDWHIRYGTTGPSSCSCPGCDLRGFERHFGGHLRGREERKGGRRGIVRGR
jgi:hypothetical protein